MYELAIYSEVLRMSTTAINFQVLSMHFPAKKKEVEQLLKDINLIYRSFV